jgi:hydrogenase expression/formation protein HypD
MGVDHGNKEDFSAPEEARKILAHLRDNPPKKPARIMNVCGSHERAVAHLGLRKALGKTLRLIPGPGCPVCVCPSRDLETAARLALQPGLLLAAYGDLLRVPFSSPVNGARSLAECKENGARLHVVASPTDARTLALAHPGEPVVFFSAGFETTTAPLAALVAAGMPDNLSLLLSHKRTSPAVRVLLESGEPGFDALIAPGHVSAITGAEEWRFVAADFGIPVAVCGFYDLSLILGIRSLCSMISSGTAALDNCYPQVVKPEGNRKALELMGEVFEVCDVAWRGVGVLPLSGYRLAEGYRHFDARVRFGLPEGAEEPETMPEGCACHHVVMGRKTPAECPLFGTLCTPREPVGPCMVSDEGACRIWHRYGGGY